MSDAASSREGTISVSRLVAGALSLSLVGLSLWWVSQSGPRLAVDSLPGEQPVVEPLQVDAPAPDNTMVCQGPLLGFVGQETTPRGFGSPDVLTLGPEIEQIPLTSELLQDVLAGTEGAVAADPTAFRQSAEAGFLDGSTRQSIDNPFARGLAVASCEPPVAEAWLVAGSTVTGRQAVLSLANPGQVAATVDLTIYGTAGEISAPAARGILLQPGERRVLSVSGLAPNETSPVIRVQSSGTAVSAAIHVTVVRGLQPDGLDIALGQEPPSLTRVIPGLLLETADRLALVTGQEGYDDVGPVLRLLSPDADASVTISILRPGLGGTTSQVSLQAGRVFDVAIDQLGQGSAAVQIDSDQPVVAGIRHSSVAEGRTDVAWIPSAPLVSELASVVVPGGGSPQLHAVNTGDQPATLRYARVSSDGQTVLSQGQLSVEPGKLAVSALGAEGGNYLFETDGSLAIGVLWEDEGSIGNLVARPPAAQAPSVSVYSR